MVGVCASVSFGKLIWLQTEQCSSYLGLSKGALVRDYDSEMELVNVEDALSGDRNIIS
jgi:hypothetical protein